MVLATHLNTAINTAKFKDSNTQWPLQESQEKH